MAQNLSSRAGKTSESPSWLNPWAPKASWELTTVPDLPQHPHTLSSFPTQSHISSPGNLSEEIGYWRGGRRHQNGEKSHQNSYEFLCVKTKPLHPKAEILKAGALQYQTYLFLWLAPQISSCEGCERLYSNLNMFFFVVKWIHHQNCWATDQSRDFSNFESLNHGWKCQESSLCLGWF